MSDAPAAPAAAAVAAVAAAPANDNASAGKIRQLEAQRDELQKSLQAALKKTSGRKPGAETAARINEMTRDLGSLHTRIDVLEARRAPYTAEELALLTQPDQWLSSNCSLPCEDLI